MDRSAASNVAGRGAGGGIVQLFTAPVAVVGVGLLYLASALRLAVSPRPAAAAEAAPAAPRVPAGRLALAFLPVHLSPVRRRRELPRQRMPETGAA